MKKTISLLAVAVCALVLMGCKPEANGGKKDNSYQEKPNLVINGNEIPFSGSLVIPAGTVTGDASNAINGETNKGVFSVEGRDLDIPAFEIGQYEVTQRLYKAVMSDDETSDPEPSYCQDKNSSYVYSDANADEKDLRPVENVTWFDAVYFCNKLSKKTGKVPYYIILEIQRDSDKHITSATVIENDAENAKYGYRLPTEAEWEYAARGGNPSETEWGNFFAGAPSSSTNDGNTDLDSVGWYMYNTANDGTTPEKLSTPASGKKGYGTHRVGLKSPVSERKKLYDMSGNVWEWCWDWYDTISATTPISGPESGTDRVRRGGGWYSEAYNCAVVNRSRNLPKTRKFFFGFRVVCTAQ